MQHPLPNVENVIYIYIICINVRVDPHSRVLSIHARRDRGGFPSREIIRNSQITLPKAIRHVCVSRRLALAKLRLRET